MTTTTSHHMTQHGSGGGSLGMPSPPPSSLVTVTSSSSGSATRSTTKKDAEVGAVAEEKALFCIEDEEEEEGEGEDEDDVDRFSLKTVMDRRNAAPPDDVVSWWLRLVRGGRWWILLLSLGVIWPWGFYSLGRLTQATDSTFSPMEGTPSAEAVDLYRQAYSSPNSNGGMAIGDPSNTGLYLVLSLDDVTWPAGETNETFAEGDVVPEETSRFALCLKPYLTRVLFASSPLTLPPPPSTATTCPAVALPPQLETIVVDPADENAQVEVVSYYSLQKAQLTEMAAGLLDETHRTTLLKVDMGIPAAIDASSDKRRAYVNNLLTALRYYGTLEAPTGVHVGYTGVRFFQQDLLQGLLGDLKRMDGIVLPLALFILTLVLRNFRLVVIPLLTIGTSVCLWSILLYPLALRVQITQFTPSIMMSLTLGLGIDYTLFLLSRLQQDLKSSKMSLSEAMKVMMRHVGHTILVSGITLLCTFLGLAILPLQMIRSVGIGAAVAIFTNIVVNLTLVPALLSTCCGDWLLRRRGGGGRYPHWTTSWLRQSAGYAVVKASQSSIVDDEAEAETNATTTSSRRFWRRLSSSFFSNTDTVADVNVDKGSSASTTPPEDTAAAAAAAAAVEAVLPRSSPWRRLGLLLLHPVASVVIFLVVLVGLLPVSRYALHLQTSINFILLLPSSSPSLHTFEDLGRAFGQGSLRPFRLLFHAPVASNQTVDTPYGFKVMHDVIRELLELDDLFQTDDGEEESEEEEEADSHGHGRKAFGFSYGPHGPQSSLVESLTWNAAKKDSTTFTGIAFVHDYAITHTVFTQAQACATPCTTNQVFHSLLELDNHVTSSDRRTTYVTAVLPTNPFNAQGVAWLEAARGVLERLQNDKELLHGYQVLLEGGSTLEYDAVQQVYSSFRWMIGLTLAIVFVLVGLFFRSVVTPLRSVVSIAMTLCFCFGLLQQWQTNEISWIAPVMAFSIIVGLALDYDIFLISRVLELRTWGGHAHGSSIVTGLHETGGIITAAGVIMSVAFGGLLGSSSRALRQWAFLLTVSVLLDTFVIRTIVVPILLGFTGRRWSWWPRTLPPERMDCLAASSGPTMTTTKTTTTTTTTTVDSFCPGTV